ncbi:MAG: 3-isopropylmalate dehydratase small subunit [Spirochaetaceae bacterium]|jgi:3-isopropylmalate/(R)-2-methylmalate dehydratase small subunit|nr:3-isopropylmalate dehydratase small subunit [Spirochaetaceae bacterium]
MKTFGGNVLFLDRSDINTDEIIPAKYLNEASKQALGPFLLEDLKLEGFDAKRSLKDAGALVTRANFGCGSSREHAPWALEANGINIVIAESFARIFRQNMYNCGMIACELARGEIAALFSEFSGQKTMLEVDIQHEKLLFSGGHAKKSVPFLLQGFERGLVEAGGWVDYAASRY